MLKQGKYSCPHHQEESIVLCAQLVRCQFAYPITKMNFQQVCTEIKYYYIYNL